jgi:plastocyanin
MREAETVRPRTLLLFALVVLLGAAAAVPALAAAAEVKLEVNENCVENAWPCWTAGSGANPPPALKITIAAGDEIKFTEHDPTTAAAVVWTTSAPACTGVPTSAMNNWEGTCTFATPGTYKFESSTLFDNENTLYGKANYRKYEITVAGAPTDATTSASGETQTEAMLNGSINPEGKTVEYHFEYEGPGVTGKQSTTPATLSGAVFTSDPVSAQVTGLQPGGTYHFLLVATCEGKTVAGATTLMFMTHALAAPTATTLAAEGLKETEATVKGTVNLGGEATEYFFEYGTDTNYGQQTAKATLQTSGASNQGVSVALKGLNPGTEYHFRLVAENKHGSEKGLDSSFKTASPPAKEPTKEPPAKEPTPTPTPTGGNPTATTSSSSSSGQPKTEPAFGPLFGSLKLASTQHGGVVRGSLVVSSSGTGGDLQIELLTKGAAAPVGKLVRSSLRGSKLTFALPLSAKGKAALRRHRRLTLTVKITLTPQHGAAVTLTRVVVVHP